MSQATVMYGITNCDTVKKARAWLQERDIDYQFHDFRKQGLPTELVQQWLDQVDATVLLNKRGTTWRKLPESSQQLAETDQLASLMAEHPTLIKRPVLQHGATLQVGFSDSHYAELFNT